MATLAVCGSTKLRSRPVMVPEPSDVARWIALTFGTSTEQPPPTIQLSKQIHPNITEHIIK